MTRGPALVVLAAGASSRLGACKALVRLREREPSTPLAHVFDAAVAFDAAPPLLVTGAHHDALVRAVPSGVTTVRNERWSQGRMGSVAAAVAVRAGFDLCLSPVDVPLVPRGVYDPLRAAWLAAGSPARGWLAPRVVVSRARDAIEPTPRAGEIARHGHPVIVGRALLEEVARFPPDTALRELRARAEPLFDLVVEATEVLDDLDTPADLHALRLRFSR